MTERVARLDWAAVAAELDELGVARTGELLDADECLALIDCYDDDRRFRSTVDMARHRFGEGQYRYFAYPLPEIVAQLRAAFWPHLLPIARQWAARLERPERPTLRAALSDGSPSAGASSGDRPDLWPDSLEDWLARCHRVGQTRPTPLILRYGPGDWNALHRDLYGDLVFPLQGHRAEQTGRGLRGWRLRRGRTTTAGAVPAHRRHHRARPRRRLHHPGTTGPVGAWMVEEPDAPRRQRRPRGAASYPRDHLPRRRMTAPRTWRLVGPDGQAYDSDHPGQFGGHRRSRIYGRLDCRTALAALARGRYARHRVFFADEATAVSAGYRPCAVCMRPAYNAWKGKGQPRNVRNRRGVQAAEICTQQTVTGFCRSGQI